MGKISITKEFSWDMAHMLSNHRGLCSNLHGHTYRMQVQISRKDKGVLEDTLHSDGMVMDFSDLKAIVQRKIIEPLDHAFMFWCDTNDSVERQIAELLKSSGKKVASVKYRPTAEEMAASFFDVLTQELADSDIVVDKIKIWETTTSFAEVIREV
ncbi:hypothetical protein Cpap_1445 [Ruminiclostridium papyrosolvens DSM 2782]|uniref:6-carboxy-5,6,7,8-tetrahydropterin synthase n=1 Tax=Ruminiclostridium papyrosolvens DSM 2782 TaxID=588581 RepID=F1TE87_9FIRM|nr:6-carboxytetrahydropterin synthase [Ruminiclostridium papyrosolvens]EGD47053.1 hypothetical protein Cpap_1445 [Ruminiclostridium papyrosolvens DSM 2782]WES35996.1 6-carboxytetrahydropterin synthase [Ruminiclostridium papyrosolvens DSM 2782]